MTLPEYMFGPCDACGAGYYSVCVSEMILTGCCDACSHPVVTVVVCPAGPEGGDHAGPR